MVVMSVLTLLNCAAAWVYIGLRFSAWVRLLAPAFPEPLFWVVYALVAVVMPIALAQRRGRLAYAGGIWIAVFIYSLLANMAVDIVRQLSRLWNGGSPAFFNPTVSSGALTLVLVAAVILGGMLNAKTIRTRRYDIPLTRVTAQTDGLRVAVVSDLHLGTVNGCKHMKKLVDAVNTARPDVVCIVGDVFDGAYEKARELEQTEALFKTIKSRYGVYAVFGNHDDNDPNGPGAAFLRRAGITLLHNEAVRLENGVTLVGRADFSPIGKKQSRKPLKAIAFDNDGPVIVLDHQPQYAAADEAAAVGADLMLSGHTHRGQMFPANLVTAPMYPTHYGVTGHNGMTMAVTSGAGTWGPPIRVGSRSEVMLLTLGENRERVPLTETRRKVRHGI